MMTITNTTDRRRPFQQGSPDPSQTRNKQATGYKAAKPLVYWGYEASPFCRLVKEELNALEIPHLQKSCARGSAKRKELKRKAGAFLVPFVEGAWWWWACWVVVWFWLAVWWVVSCWCVGVLGLTFFLGFWGTLVPHTTPHHTTDPNTGVSLFESAEIIDYLRRTYGPQ